MHWPCQIKLTFYRNLNIDIGIQNHNSLSDYRNNRSAKFKVFSCAKAAKGYHE